eukprot:scaffold118860_cov63-Phaeocystis_antarctica.AAC.6
MMRPLATAAAKLVLCKSLAVKCCPNCFSAGNWRLQSMQHHLPELLLNLTSGPSLSSKVCRASSMVRRSAAKTCRREQNTEPGLMSAAVIRLE